jgi:hypothetical protein
MEGSQTAGLWQLKTGTRKNRECTEKKSLYSQFYSSDLTDTFTLPSQSVAQVAFWNTS